MPFVDLWIFLNFNLCTLLIEFTFVWVLLSEQKRIDLRYNVLLLQIWTLHSTRLSWFFIIVIGNVTAVSWHCIPGGANDSQMTTTRQGQRPLADAGAIAYARSTTYCHPLCMMHCLCISHEYIDTLKLEICNFQSSYILFYIMKWFVYQNEQAAT